MAAPILLCSTKGMSRERWLECRANGPDDDIEYTLGGSDVAVVFGERGERKPIGRDALRVRVERKFPRGADGGRKRRERMEREGEEEKRKRAEILHDAKARFIFLGRNIQRCIRNFVCIIGYDFLY